MSPEPSFRKTYQKKTILSSVAYLEIFCWVSVLDKRVFELLDVKCKAFVVSPVTTCPAPFCLWPPTTCWNPCLKHYFNVYSYYWIFCALSSFCAFVSGDPSQNVLTSYSLIHLFPLYSSDIIKVEPYLKGSLTSIHRPPPNKVRCAFVAVEASNLPFVLFFCDFLFIC